MLAKKKILLGITGGIAAYKCAQLVRLLVKDGAEVKVILSSAARDFVTPQTLSVLSKNEVISDFFDAGHNWNNHVQLAEWADVMLIAPLTANTLAKMAVGQCDNVLMAVYLSARSKVVVAPAMDLQMYRHPTVKQNLELLEKAGHSIIPPESGELASGLVGEGRMAEPENILLFLRGFLSRNLPLSGKKVLVNAGPTYEAIDPVRYIGNRSSGKMGVALAEQFAAQGAQVILVLGPSQVAIENKSIQVIRVESGEEMYAATLTHFAGSDIVVCSAAVADYKPEKAETQKIKKSDARLTLSLVKTKDILEELGKQKKGQLLVGFALETEQLEKNALQKMKKKNLDIVVLNSAVEAGAGFGGDTNKITIIDRHNKMQHFELKSKTEVAVDIVNYIFEFQKMDSKL